MSRATRILVTIVLCGALLAATTIGLSVAAVYRAGSISVEIHEDDGQQLQVAVPAGLARIAIWLVPESLFEDLMVDEIRPLLPAVRAGWDEFLLAPDFVLAEVRDHGDRVLIEKYGRELMVRIESDGATVEIALPLATVGPLLSKLERAGATRA